ncbi:MAG: sugar ABC transporter substrate-binding protein [Planctomycetota bacterium]|nr:sugar ABC transporter substrate-binding protein [Planctomycetota bacterium]
MRKILLLALLFLFGAFAVFPAVRAGEVTIRYWYHIDNPDLNEFPGLVKKFEAANPGIKVKAELIPWGSYFDNLFTAIVGGNAPDGVNIRVAFQAQLIEMGAILPLDDRIAKWPARDDILDDFWDKIRAPDGKTYLLPLYYNAMYLYYRQDLFEKYNVKVPTNKDEFLAAAKALTLDTDGDGRTDLYGFGLRGAFGGHEPWGSMVIPNAANMTSEELGRPDVAANNQFYIDLFRVHKVAPPSAPNDGFNEVTTGFRNGLTAMLMHHIGSANAMAGVLGDKVSATPMPRFGAGGAGWTPFNEDESAILSSTKHPEETWKWISFLSEAANNNLVAKSQGQLPATKSGSAAWNLHPKRFIDATMGGLPYAYLLPLKPVTGEFITAVWPQTIQRALLGEIDSQTVLNTFDKHFNQ